MIVFLIIRCKKYVRHSLHLSSVPLDCSKMLCWNFLVYTELVTWLYWQILSGIHICHKSKLTQYMWLKSGTQMTKICTKAFLHRDMDHCALAFTGVTWNICWATWSKQLLGMDMPWWAEGKKYHLLLSAPVDWLKIKLNRSLIITKLLQILEFISVYASYIAILYSRVMWFARLGEQSHTANTELLGRKFEITKWQRSCYTSLSPLKPRHLIY